MHALFSVRNAAYVRHYDPVLRAMAGRGHRIDLVVDGRQKTRPWPEHVVALVAEFPGVRLGSTPVLTLDPWYELATAVRQNLFHARFFEPEYSATPVLRSRAGLKAPEFPKRLLETTAGRRPTVRAALTLALRAIERSTPIPPALLPYLRDMRPDVVVLTPLVVLKTVQLDLLRAARVLGIPTVWAVASWDHLSSKGLLHDCPDRVLVWNEIQRDEAVRLHGVPPQRVVITGAPVFDEWFDRTPSVSREAFCGRAGLDPDRPYVLYVGSALFEGSPSEAAFARSWIEAVRSRPALAGVGALFRPHFKRAADWERLDLRGIPNAAVWPPKGEVPVDAGSREAYFDSMFHATAVVGLNTSALIEAAVVGRPVLTVLLDQFYGNQEGTLHFRYLLREPALLRAARDLAAHAAELELVVSGRDPDPGRSARFVGRFVRPGPADVRATDLAVAAIEGAHVPVPAAPAVGTIPAFALKPLARLAVRRVERQREALRRLDAEKRARAREARRTKQSAQGAG